MYVYVYICIHICEHVHKYIMNELSEQTCLELADLTQEELRETLLGTELMECEDAFNNIQKAMPPSTIYEKENTEIFTNCIAFIKRMFWSLGNDKLTKDIEDELEYLWCKYHHFKCNYVLNDKNEIIGSTHINKYLHLRDFLKAQKESGWLFDCHFTLAWK